MLRRAVCFLPGRAPSSQRRGFLTIVLQNGHANEQAEYKLSVPWASAQAFSMRRCDRRGNADTPRVTLKSVKQGGVVASSELMTASKFESKSLRGRGRQRNLVDLLIWPQESRAIATIMRTNDKSRWTWHSTWSFNLEAATAMPADISHSQHEKSLLRINSSHKGAKGQYLQYKGFICKEIVTEFDVSMKVHFSIQQTLGRGAEGQVFKCVSQQGAHTCAIKRYNSRKPIGQEPREVRIMKMLCHPNVKKLYIAWREDKAGSIFNKESSVYLTQELCKCTFDDYLDKKTQRSSTEKLNIFKEAVTGLSYLHEQGVIHRDIKSSNMFLDEHNHVKIGDFGSGALVGSSSCVRGGRFWGTAFYASHELWLSKSHNEKTDVFSLGVVYFELFGGFATIEARCRRLEDLQKVLNSRNWKTKPLETWMKSNVSKGWTGNAELLIRMLQTSPGRRPKCSDILHMLSQ